MRRSSGSRETSKWADGKARLCCRADVRAGRVGLGNMLFVQESPQGQRLTLKELNFEAGADTEW